MEYPPITALLPMKAHSERGADKNIRPFCGRPLFHWVMGELSRSDFVGTGSERTQSCSRWMR